MLLDGKNNLDSNFLLIKVDDDKNAGVNFENAGVNQKNAGVNFENVGVNGVSINA